MTGRRPALAAAAAALAAGCGRAHEVVIPRGPVITLEPASITARARTEVDFAVQTDPGESGSVRVTVAPTTVAFVDSTPRTVPPNGRVSVTVAVVAPGSAVLRVDAALASGRVQATVPITALPATR